MPFCARSDVDFERTLISVLEHQPADSEVIVAHDGHYDDPFDLRSEVRFVVGDSDSLIHLISASASAALGQIVHIVSDGLCASPGWTDGAVEKFEQFDAGCVAPVIRDRESRIIVAAGWRDTTARLCKPACSGQIDIRGSSASSIGCYLPGSFWRREVIRSVSKAFAGQDPIEASYAYDFLAREAGWRCVRANECELFLDSDSFVGDATSVKRGMRLRAIRNHFSGRKSWSASIIAAATALLFNGVRPSRIGESLGQAMAPLASQKIELALKAGAVVPCDSTEVTVPMPSREDAPTVRRAA